MDQSINQQFELLDKTILEFQLCHDIKPKGILLTTCYKQLNILEVFARDDQSLQYTKYQELQRLKCILQAAHKVFIDETIFYSLMQDAVKLNLLKIRNVKDQSAKFFVKQIQQGQKKITRNSLSDKNKRLYDDAVNLANNFYVQQIQDLSSSYNDSRMLQELQENDHEEELYQVLKGAAELARVSEVINTEIQQQQELNNLDTIVFNTDHAVSDYIEAHDSVLSYRKQQIMIFFTTLFGVLTPIFSGFGNVVGGVAGLIVGNFLAKCSQLGFQNKVRQVEIQASISDDEEWTILGE